MRVKICGLTRAEDAQAAHDLGAWALGFIFYPKSKRFVTADAAKRIIAVLPAARSVGVFVNQTDEAISIATQAGLKGIQLHGDEGPAYADEVARRTGARIIKAARVAGEGDVRALGSFQRVDYHLLDAHVPGEPGGTGQTFEWRLALQHRGAVPLMLSGGLTPSNVAESIETVRPFAVDVASGTEASPGVKDVAKVTAFMEAVASTHIPEEATP